MLGDGVVNKGANASLGKFLLEFVALRVADDKQMPDGGGPVRDER